MLPSSERGRRFGICSTISLICGHPKLLSCSAFLHPCKVLTLLRYAHVSAVKRFLDLVPDELVRDLFGNVVVRLSRREIIDSVAPLLNNVELQETIVALLRCLDVDLLVLSIKEVPLQKLLLIMSAPKESLLALLESIDVARYKTLVVPLLQESEHVLQQVVLPIISQCHRPDLMGRLLSCLDVHVVVAMLHSVDVARIVGILNGLELLDVSRDGNLVQLLACVATDLDMLESKVIPFIQRASPDQFLPILRGVKARQLLEVLRSLSVDDLILLLTNTDPELVVRLLNGPLEGVTPIAANGLAAVMRDPRAAQTVSDVSRRLNECMQRGEAFADELVDARQDLHDEVERKRLAVSQAFTSTLHHADSMTHNLHNALSAHRQSVRDKVQSVVAHGKESRGSADSNYQIGDFTRGLLSQGTNALQDVVQDTLEKGSLARGSDAEGYQFGDLTRGLLAQGRQVVEGVQSSLHSTGSTCNDVVDETMCSNVSGAVCSDRD